MTIKLIAPENFDAERFALEFGISTDDLHIEDGDLIIAKDIGVSQDQLNAYTVMPIVNDPIRLIAVNHFDGERFAKDYGLDFDHDMWVENNELVIAKNIEITQQELDQYSILPVPDALRRAAYYEEMVTPDQMVIALWEMIVENRPEAAESLQARRLEIKNRIPKNIGG